MVVGVYSMAAPGVFKASLSVLVRFGKMEGGYWEEAGRSQCSVRVIIRLGVARPANDTASGDVP
jgi:hypothetical protein